MFRRRVQSLFGLLLPLLQLARPGQLARSRLPDPDSVVAFWPLDQRNGLQDLSGHRRPTQPYRAATNNLIKGPFGINSTSVSADLSHGNGYLFRSQFRAQSPSFSLSFAFRPGKTDCGLLTTAQTCNGLSLHYSSSEPPSLVLGSGRFPQKELARFPVLRRERWSLLTLTFNALSSQLRLLDRDQPLASRRVPEIGQLQRFDNGLQVGHSCFGGRTDFASDSALACLAVHNRPITGQESGKLFEACRLQHAASVPQLPFDPELIIDDPNFSFDQFLQMLERPEPTTVEPPYY